MSRFWRDEVIFIGESRRVFRGRLADGTPVALKEELHQTLEDANRALQEALTMKGLHHANICRVLDCRLEEDGSGLIKTVLATELMDSDLAKETERRRLTHMPWSDAELYFALRCLVSALSYAQSMGVAHRDIKPQNVFYSDGGLKIGDFGSSTQLHAANSAYSLQGSPLFLSPEQKRGYIQMLRTGERNLYYDPVKSDVYSLGMTMLHLALLGPPTQLTSLETLERDTQVVLAGLGNYPYLQYFLRFMLVAREDQRPSLSDLLALFKQIEEGSSAQPLEKSEVLSFNVIEGSPGQSDSSLPKEEQSPSVSCFLNIKRAAATRLESLESRLEEAHHLGDSFALP